MSQALSRTAAADTGRARRARARSGRRAAKRRPDESWSWLVDRRDADGSGRSPLTRDDRVDLTLAPIQLPAERLRRLWQLTGLDSSVDLHARGMPQPEQQ